MNEPKIGDIVFVEYDRQVREIKDIWEDENKIYHITYDKAGQAVPFSSLDKIWRVKKSKNRMNESKVDDEPIVDEEPIVYDEVFVEHDRQVHIIETIESREGKYHITYTDNTGQSIPVSIPVSQMTKMWRVKNSNGGGGKRKRKSRRASKRKSGRRKSRKH